MKRIVIKTGGNAASDSKALKALAHEMKDLSEEYSFLVVHGGGSVVSSIQKIYGIDPRFIDGKRMTSPREMDLVDMGLSGKMNTYLVRLFGKEGHKAVGLTGADGLLFTGESIDKESSIQSGEVENRTGKIIQTDISVVKLLEDNGYTPIVCSVSVDKEGRGININADEAALALSEALGAETLVFISDIPGILKENSVIPSLNRDESYTLIRQGIIKEGMIPKVESSIKALEQGTGSIVIGEFKEPGDLRDLIEHRKGTELTLQ